MPSTTFSDYTTVVSATWLNEVNGVVWTLFGATTTAAGGRTALGLGTISTQASSNVSITGGSISGITDLAVADGGTGASDAATARTNLGVAASGANSDITSLTALSTPLSVAQGGIGAATLSANAVLLGNGTSAPQTVAPSTSGNILTSNGTTWTSAAPAVAQAGFSTMEVTTSGTTWSVPASLQVTGAKWKCTVVGGGGGGGGTTSTASAYGGGGGSGAVTVMYYTYVAGQNKMTYVVGAAGTAAAGGGGTTQSGTGGNSSVTYDSVTATANGGAGGTESVAGAGGTATGGTLNFTGSPGWFGFPFASLGTGGYGGDAPLGLGQGGCRTSSPATGAVGVAGTGYGAGGGGASNGSGSTQRAGSAGTAGVVIIEY